MATQRTVITSEHSDTKYSTLSVRAVCFHVCVCICWHFPIYDAIHIFVWKTEAETHYGAKLWLHADGSAEHACEMCTEIGLSAKIVIKINISIPLPLPPEKVHFKRHIENLYNLFCAAPLLAATCRCSVSVLLLDGVKCRKTHRKDSPLSHYCCSTRTHSHATCNRKQIQNADSNKRTSRCTRPMSQ